MNAGRRPERVVYAESMRFSAMLAALLAIGSVGCTQPHLIKKPDAGMSDAGGQDGGEDCMGAPCCKSDETWDGTHCASSPCLESNGGCDALATCSTDADKVVCDCGTGFTLSVERKCIPELTDLKVSVGKLAPAFNPTTKDYTLQLALANDVVQVAPFADQRVAIKVDDAAWKSGKDVQVAMEMFSEHYVKLSVTAKNGESRDYTVHVTRAPVGQQIVSASMPTEDALFGFSIAISGDVAVIGVPYEARAARGINDPKTDPNMDGTDSGAVYVYRFDGKAWKQEAYIKALNSDAEDFFGTSVAVDGDRIAVGAPYEDSATPAVNGDESNNDCQDSGAVFLFKRVQGKWQREAYIKARYPHVSSEFGSRVALEGSTLIVSAIGESSSVGGVNQLGSEMDEKLGKSGAVYVFAMGANSAWTQHSFIKPALPQASMFFGTEVALSGDLLAVGAQYEAGASRGISGDESVQTKPKSGAVFTFKRENDAWTKDAYIKASNADENDSFGGALALRGNRLLVGAPYEDGAPAAHAVDAGDDVVDSGAVYVLEREGGVWRETAYVKPDGSKGDELFGRSVSLCTDDIAFVGAPLRDVGRVPNAGTAMVLRFQESWKQVWEIVPPGEGTARGHEVGCSDKHLFAGEPDDTVTVKGEGSVLAVF